MPERKPCPNLETNNKDCTCPKLACPNHGFCCACVQQHRVGGSLPMCLRDLKPRG